MVSEPRGDHFDDEARLVGDDDRRRTEERNLGLTFGLAGLSAVATMLFAFGANVSCTNRNSCTAEACSGCAWIVPTAVGFVMAVAAVAWSVRRRWFGPWAVAFIGSVGVVVMLLFG